MDVKIPEVGESIHEALISRWVKADGDAVTQDEVICELETDKINVELQAEASGVLHISQAAGETVPVGTLIATIEEGAAPAEQKQGAKEEPKAEAEAEEEEEQKAKQKEAEPPPEAEEPTRPAAQKAAEREPPPASPAARQLAREKRVDLAAVNGSGRGGRITVEDVHQHVEPASSATAGGQGRPVTREAMSPIRQRIAARLLEARQQTAMLTTFNEADMSRIKTLRAHYQEHFTTKHGIKLGLMSFFVKATVAALKEIPAVNARIDGQEIVYHHYYDIGIAVGTERGLVVPVLRNADELTFAAIEQQIADLAARANNRKLTLAELEGGTFTISNGGVYGSVLSTPIINPPQTGVLGMHAIQDRAVVRDGEIVIRPIMNLALSYDHRLIDGREAVSFLKLIKEYIEDPSELLLEL